MPRLVLIEWMDSRQPEPSWQRLDDIEHLESCTCLSVGFVVQETKKEIVLAPNIADMEDNEPAQGSGFITIPLCAVKSVADLERPTTVGRKLATA